MSTFGYRKELKKYESVDEDEVLAGLSFEELQELERELADMDPDDNVPIGLRQKDQTAKTPTGTFSREALLKYWEDETHKLLEDDRSESSPEHVRKGMVFQGLNQRKQIYIYYSIDALTSEGFQMQQDQFQASQKILAEQNNLKLGCYV